MKTKTPRKQLITKCDRLWSQYIRCRDGQCVRCGSDHPLDAAHIISRSFQAVRWDPSNGIALCKGCHMWWHKEPILAGRWLESKYPGRFTSVHHTRLMNTYPKFDLEIVHQLLTDLLAQLKNHPE